MAFASINQASVGGGSSNALSIQSDGIFMPRLSTGQRTALALTTSDAGLTVYDFTLNNLFIWNGAAWESIPGSGDAGANGSVQYNDNGIVSGATNFVWDKVNGRVGIGTATPLSKLQSVGTVSITDGASTGAANGLHLRFDTGINTAYISAFHSGVDNRDLIYDAKSHVWQLPSGTGMTLNSTGRLGVGVTPSAWDNPYKCVQLSGGSLSVYPTTDLYISQNAYNSGGWKRVAAGYASQYIQTNSEHRFLVAGTSTTDSAIAFTQAMTLDASGRLMLGKTASALGTVGFETAAGGFTQSTVTSDASLFCNRLATDGETIKFYRQTLQVGNISVTTTATAYNTSSDYRLKEDAQPLVGGLARVNALKPSIYKWKVNGSTGEGFIAHELADVVPFAVTGEKDAVNEDGSINAQSVDMSRIVPILVAAIQELTARVKTLESR
jgi:hypothetical protein